MATMTIMPQSSRRANGPAVKISRNGDIYINSVLGESMRRGVRYRIELHTEPYGPVKMIRLVPDKDGYMPSAPGSTTSMLMRCRVFSKTLEERMKCYPFDDQIPAMILDNGVIIVDDIPERQPDDSSW